MKITVLGSGTSHGIPVVGCDCPVCFSCDERDRRMRCSLYIEGAGGERALIDAGPEFRLQAIRAGIKRLDGIFLTHSHADHLHGLDDVRPLCWEKALPVYGNEPTIAEMKERFSYIWRETQQLGGGKPKLIPIVVEKPVQIGNLTFRPLPLKHGVLDILGWEVEDNYLKDNYPVTKSLLYLTDVSRIPPSTSASLLNSNSSPAIIIGALRTRPHETHFTFEEAINAALSFSPNVIYLTHICHNHSHTEIEEICLIHSKGLPDIEIHPAYDGLELNL